MTPIEKKICEILDEVEIKDEYMGEPVYSLKSINQVKAYFDVINIEYIHSCSFWPTGNTAVVTFSWFDENWGLGMFTWHCFDDKRGETE